MYATVKPWHDDNWKSRRTRITRGGSHADRPSDRVEAGEADGEAFAAHGGVKNSGYGKDMSVYALEDYTVARHVMVKLG